MKKLISKEKRKKIELRQSINQLENFLLKIDQIKDPGISHDEINLTSKSLKKIIRAVRSYHTGVSALFNTFDILDKNLKNKNS